MEEKSPHMETEVLRSFIHTALLFKRIVGENRLKGSFICYRTYGKKSQKILSSMGASSTRKDFQRNWEDYES